MNFDNLFAQRAVELGKYFEHEYPTIHIDFVQEKWDDPDASPTNVRVSASTDREIALVINEDMPIKGASHHTFGYVAMLGALISQAEIDEHTEGTHYRKIDGINNHIEDVSAENIAKFIKLQTALIKRYRIITYGRNLDAIIDTSRVLERAYRRLADWADILANKMLEK